MRVALDGVEAMARGRRMITSAAILMLCFVFIFAGGALLAPVIYPHIETGRLWHDVIGIDVSHHQGKIDWRRVGQSDVAFAYIKASEGGDFRDKRFRENWDEAKAVGIPRGAYHYFTPCRTGAEQAENFIAAVPRDGEALPPVVDAEHMRRCRSGPTVADLRAEIEIFLDRLTDHYGRRPIIYTTGEFNEAFLGGHMQRETFWARNLWTPFLPPLFRRDQWLFWQFHNRGRRPGITGPVDLNAFRGSKSDFQAFL